MHKLRSSKWWQTCLTEKEDAVLSEALKEAIEVGRAKNKSDFTRQALKAFALNFAPSPRKSASY